MKETQTKRLHEAHGGFWHSLVPHPCILIYLHFPQQTFHFAAHNHPIM